MGLRSCAFSAVGCHPHPTALWSTVSRWILYRCPLGLISLKMPPPEEGREEGPICPLVSCWVSCYPVPPVKEALLGSHPSRLPPEQVVVDPYREMTVKSSSKDSLKRDSFTLFFDGDGSAKGKPSQVFPDHPSPHADLREIVCHFVPYLDNHISFSLV